MVKRLAILPIPGSILAIGVAAILDVRGIYEPVWLLPTANLVFLFVPGWIIAYVSVQGYLTSGSLPLLLFGGAAMVYGTGSGVGGWMVAILGAVDAGIVLHNIVSAIGGILNVWSGLLATQALVASSVAPRRTKALLLYAGLGGILLGLSIASLRGLTPAFVVPGGGFTPIRNATLAIAVAGFAASALLFWKRYLERRSDFLFWGTLALAMLSIGLSGLFLQRGVGTLVGWCSRSAQYVGSAYFLIAVVRAWRAAQRTNVPVARAIASLFREAEANYRALVDAATDAIVAFDSGGRVLLWNPAAERMFGCAHDEAIGEPFGKVTGLPAEIERWTAEQAPSANSGVVIQDSGVKSQAMRRDGRVFPVECSVSVRRAEDGLIGTVIVRDTTERRRAEQTLRDLSSRQEALLAAIPDIIMEVDAAKVYTWANQAGVEFFGKDVIGREAAYYFIGEQDTYRTVKPLFQGDGNLIRVESWQRRHDGEARLLAWRCRVLKDPSGNVEGVLSSARDITDRKRLEDERIRLEAQLRQHQKLEALGTLASGVAHEINNPITGIMSYAQLIADKVEPGSQAAEYAGEIVQETERVATIVRNLLQFARQEKQAHSPARIEDILEQTLSLLRAVFRRDQITLTVDVPDGLPALKCRSQQLQQVLMNLLTNARDALNEKYPGYHPDKTIRITAREVGGGIADCRLNGAGTPNLQSEIVNLQSPEGRWLRLTVADQGPGIPPEIQARIFDPFFTTKPRDQGTGLGLSISHGIVKEHHGALHCETEPGAGTQFHLDLPVDNGRRMEEE
jgi:PAS domain S-box-containing protein